MKSENQKTVWAILLTCFLTSLLLSAYFLSYATRSGSPVFEHPGEAYTYTVWKEGSTFYCKDGLLGNVSSSANDDTLIQAAIDAANGEGGGTVFIKANTYTASVTVKANVLLLLEAGVSGVTYTVNSNAYVMRYAGGYTILEQPLNMSGNELLFGAFHAGSSTPHNFITGQWWYDTSSYVLKVFNGSAWDAVSGAQGPAGPAGQVEGGDYSYLVFKNATATYMVNGDTGAIDWGHSNSSRIFEACIGNFTNTGGKIFVRKGQYTDVSFIINRPAVTIEGESASFDRQNEGDYCVQFDGADGKDVIRIDDAYVTKYVVGVTIRNIWFQGATTNSGHGVSSTDVDDTHSVCRLRIEECNFANFQGTDKYGIKLKNPEQCYIIGNKFKSISSTGGFIHIYNTNYMAGAVLIEHNQFTPNIDGTKGVVIESQGYMLAGIYARSNLWMVSAGTGIDHTAYTLDSTNNNTDQVWLYGERFEKTNCAVNTTGGNNIRYFKMISCVWQPYPGDTGKAGVRLSNNVRGADISQCVFDGDSTSDGNTGIVDSGPASGSMQNHVHGCRFNAIEFGINGTSLQSDNVGWP